MQLLRLLSLASLAVAAPASSSVPVQSASADANAPPATPSPASAYAYYGVTPTSVTFDSSSTPIVGYHYAPPSSSDSAPVVLIAHGLGGLQTSRIMPFAAKFASLGYHAITFDYRYWGFSSGKPRNIIDVNSQEDDYAAAAAFAKTLPGVDPSRIVLWATSLSGGHVLQIAGRKKIPGQVATIAQCPHVNGPATVSLLPPASLLPLITAGVADSTGGGVSALLPILPPLYIPLSNKTGQFGALTQAGAYEGYLFVQPNPPAPGNVFPARFVTQLPFFSPDSVAAESKLPTFIGVGTTDNIVGPAPAVALAGKMQNVELHSYDGGHFSVYYGADKYEPILADQVAFLQKNVPLK